jgi:hypothetical protein
MMMRSLWVVLAFAAATPAFAQMQLPGWPKRVDGQEENHRAEVALAVNRAGTDVMVAWMHYHTLGSQAHVHVHYNVAVNGSTFRTDPGIIPYPSPLPPGGSIRGGDPVVAFGKDGTGWVGALQGAPTRRRVWVSKKAAGAPYAQTADDAYFPSEDYSIDKPVLAAGPTWSGIGEHLGLTFAPKKLAPWRLQRVTSTDQAATWVYPHLPVGPDHAEGNSGGANRMLILRNGPNTGRWVVAYRPDVAQTLPEAVYTTVDQAGNLDWHNSVNPTRARIPGSISTEAIPGGFPEDFMGVGGIKTVNFPDIAAHPYDVNTIYMVFPARKPGNLNNIDLYIARSTDGGVNFSGPSGLEGIEVLRLRDVEDLGEVDGSHQLMPTIAVDHHGGVNVFYYSARKLNNVWHYQPKYLRIANFQTHPHPSVVQFALTNSFELDSAPVMQSTLGIKFFGDYIQADSRRCIVYAGFPSRHDGGVTGIYVTMIEACIEVDFDQDGDVTMNDADLFAQYFAASDLRADLDGDGELTTNDVNCFLQAFACVCNP